MQLGLAISCSQNFARSTLPLEHSSTTKQLTASLIATPMHLPWLAARRNKISASWSLPLLAASMLRCRQSRVAACSAS